MLLSPPSSLLFPGLDSFIVCKMLSFSVEGAGGPLLEEGASPAVPGGCMMGQQYGCDDI